MKTKEQINQEYTAKESEYRALGVAESMLIKLLADAGRVRDAELAELGRVNSQAIQLTPTLSLSFPVLEDTVKEDRKTKQEYRAVKGGTVNLSYRVGKGKQTSYTAYLPLAMYEAILNTQDVVKERITERLDSGHLFKVSGITSVQGTPESRTSWLEVDALMRGEF